MFGSRLQSMVRTEGFVCQNYYVFAFAGGGGGGGARILEASSTMRKHFSKGLGVCWVGVQHVHQKPHLWLPWKTFLALEVRTWCVQKQVHDTSFWLKFQRAALRPSEQGPLFERRSTQPKSNFVQYTAPLRVRRSWYFEMGSSCRKTILLRAHQLRSSAPKSLLSFHSFWEYEQAWWSYCLGLCLTLHPNSAEVIMEAPV